MPTDDNFTAGGTYQVNVDRLVHLLRDEAARNGGFFNTSYGNQPHLAFGLVMCYADYTWDECLFCLERAAAWVGAGCPYSRKASANYDICLLRYSDEPFFGSLDLTLTAWVLALANVTDAARMNDTRCNLIGRLTGEAAGSPRRFAYGNRSYVDSQGESQVIYALAQCRRDLEFGECNRCLNYLREELEKKLPSNIAGYVLAYSCYIRYNLAGPMEIIQPPPPASPPEGPLRTKRKLTKVIMVVAGSSIAGTMVLLLCLGVSGCYFLRWSKGRTKSAALLTFLGGEAMEIDKLERGTGPRRFSYDELAAATENFSKSRKLGEGGFGSVYRGFLEELNVHMAVKRVSRSSRQGLKEFMSEVKIISRLRHRNLVVLIGWCYGIGDDLLLVYELMHNGSVDGHLYPSDPDKQLKWPTRYKIVLGLGSALVYLHHDMEQCVVHRDIKPSNVMLDASFNAKLGDFGLARVINDGRRSHTTGVAGTMGYMDPVCVATGKTSVESDVYSFGVVLLEIACGRGPAVRVGDDFVHLVQWVWELYGDRTILDAADARLGGEFDAREVVCTMLVGLWCTHPDRSLRPTIRQALNVLRFEVPPPSLAAKMPVATYGRLPGSSDSITWWPESTAVDDRTNGGHSTTTTTPTTERST